MPFEIVRNAITNMQVNGVVNAASRLPWVNAGVDSAIHNSGKKNSTVHKKASCCKSLYLYSPIISAAATIFPRQNRRTIPAGTVRLLIL